MKRPLLLLLVALAFAPAGQAQRGSFSSTPPRDAHRDAGGAVQAAPAPYARPLPRLVLGAQAGAWAAQMAAAPRYDGGLGKTAAALLKLDARARMLVATQQALGKNTAFPLDVLPSAPVTRRDGRALVDVMALLDGGASTAALEALGATVQLRTGDIVALRVPLDRLEMLAARAEVRRIETGDRMYPTMAVSRADIRADLVHAGVGLPGPIMGEGVVVGVLDSGLDVTHPDFFDEGGSRVQYLLEYKDGGTEAEWTKAQIDANPAAVSERDGNGAGGHGTHVTGTAAGGGRADAAQRGIAPKADIVFVKGIRDAGSSGGFSSNDVVAGVQYIFSRATALGKPAVVNLSLGSNGGPLDGTTLQERSLSSLVGPGRIIVASAGNEGFDLIHAGGTTSTSQPSQTLLLPDTMSTTQVDVWYEQGAVTEASLIAYSVTGGTINKVWQSPWMPVGSGHANWQPVEPGERTLAEYAIDASQTRDSFNGDGNVTFFLRSTATDDAGDYVWGIVTRGTRADRLDMWANGGIFYNAPLGFAGLTEMPGNTDQTVDRPSTADKVISVASYVTTNAWTDIDGNRWESRMPNPDRQGEPVQPTLGQRSYFSSMGPRRDGRAKPDIAAPGERIFSAFSSHLDENVGYARSGLLAGGRYQGLQGTSMASPHVTGVVALMLQVNPALDYGDVLDVLRSTARTDLTTGTPAGAPWGAGRVDALAAVQEAYRRAGGTPGGGTTVQATLSRFEPTGQQVNYILDDVLPVDSGFVAGMNQYGDRAKATHFTLPEGVFTAKITGVNVWFGYKKPSASGTFAVEISSGTPETGPGAVLYRQEFDYAKALADDSFGTREAASALAFDTPVDVGGPFFVSIDFGAYGAAAAGNLTIATTTTTGARVAHVWEKWSNGAWHNLSDAWWTPGQGAPGTNGVDLWIQSNIAYLTSTAAEDGTAPASLGLGLAGPNPFRDATVLAYSLPQPGHVSIAVYDLLGRRVALLVDGVQAAGTYTAPLGGDDLASGLYLVRLEADGQVRTQRVVRVQ